ncbi:MAG: hypothetical protein M1818_000145 [Claussenomyces sp. TS43310]|nr:MAG: hypothetical protein M1818_000145 [Claussenomyces sp. TS43310]
MPSPTREQQEPLIIESMEMGGWAVEDAYDNGKQAVGDSLSYAKSAILKAWSKTTRRMRAAAGILIFFIVAISLWRPLLGKHKIPSLHIDYGAPLPSIYNVSKVALLIENRPNPVIAPLMLHFMSVVPPDWRFRFMGSIESVQSINQSLAIRNMVDIGKLDLTYIPSNMSTAGQEQISRFLTNLWIYETVLAPAEWLLMFQTDSMLCANSKQSINDWLEYDWVGAPWDPNGPGGGNGGLSLRRVSAIVDVLRSQTRMENSQPEDVWLCERLLARPNARMANGSMEVTFSGEMNSGPLEKVGVKKGSKDDHGHIKGIDDWRDGFYEPMGYHTGSSGRDLHGPIWGTPEMRKHIWQYCPEMKMTLAMDAAYYVPGVCNSNWKRDGSILGGPNFGVEMGWERPLDPTEVDEDGYPYLPANLVPW